MTEPPCHSTIHGKELTKSINFNNIFKWPGTGTWTLQPLQGVTDFYESDHWESIKFRLTDCDYNHDWWNEVPDHVRADFGPCDYFFNQIVRADLVPPGFPSKEHPNITDILTPVGETALINAINREQKHQVAVIRSKAILPANQGYHLRLNLDGRPSIKRANLMDFYFGNFCVVFNSFGTALLYQTADFVIYKPVYAFPWSLPDQAHGGYHELTIFPHGKNAIEFRSLGHHWGISVGPNFSYTDIRDTIQGGLYVQPEVIYQNPEEPEERLRVPLITLPNNWTLVTTREFRVHIQISKLSFVNGSLAPGRLAGSAGFWDEPFDIKNRTGYPFPPTLPITMSVESIENGGETTWELWNPDANEGAGGPYSSDGVATRVQPGVGMVGLGDIPGPGLGSSTSPEFFSYTLDKPAKFETVSRSEVFLPVMAVGMDLGDSPEAERLTIHLDNSQGQAEAWTNRAVIPLELVDIDSDLLLFEGNAIQVHATRCSSERPDSVTIEACGMVDNLLRFEWSGVPPNFERDPNDTQSKGWPMGDIIRQCFESAGESAEDVVIEEEETYLRYPDGKPFRLWTSPGESPSTGGGHEGGATPASRWQPRSGTPVHEFTDFFIRDILGWHWSRSREDRKWHIFKRPDPNNPLDEFKFTPLVEFYDDAHPPTGDVPNIYKHAKMQEEVQRPRCTTILIKTIWNRNSVATRQELNERLNDATPDTGEGDVPGASPLVTAEPKLTILPFTNYRGYPNPKNNPPDTTHPDFMGENRSREIKIIQGNTPEALNWIGRRVYYDNCFGYVFRTLEADWGDAYTYNLRKYDPVIVNGTLWLIDRIEPEWGGGGSDVVRRARYRVSQFREDAPPPR